MYLARNASRRAASINPALMPQGLATAQAAGATNKADPTHGARAAQGEAGAASVNSTSPCGGQERGPKPIFWSYPIIRALQRIGPMNTPARPAERGPAWADAAAGREGTAEATRLR